MATAEWLLTGVLVVLCVIAFLLFRIFKLLRESYRGQEWWERRNWEHIDQLNRQWAEHAARNRDPR